MAKKSPYKDIIGAVKKGKHKEKRPRSPAQKAHVKKLVKEHGWKKGKDGGPGAPKKADRLTSYLKEQLKCVCSSVPKFEGLAKEMELDPETTLIGELLTALLIDRALDGVVDNNLGYLKELINRVDGKVVEKIEQTIQATKKVIVHEGDPRQDKAKPKDKE